MHAKPQILVSCTSPTVTVRGMTSGWRLVADSWAMPLARMRSVVLDCPDPRAIAECYRAVLGGHVTFAEEDWVVLTVDGLRLAFQLVDEFAAPTWPKGERPQQFHLDVTVDDVDAAEPRVLALGATKREVQPGQAAGDSTGELGFPERCNGHREVSDRRARGVHWVRTRMRNGV
jgi:hypothetical protein